METVSPAVRSEQQHLDLLYRLLDQQRRRTQGLKDAALRENDGTPAGLFNRDALQFRYAEELAVLAAAEDKLCFGRLDTGDSESIHVGRMGLSDDTPARRQVLMDWRAPLAAPFYTATALDPQGVGSWVAVGVPYASTSTMVWPCPRFGPLVSAGSWSTP